MLVVIKWLLFYFHSLIVVVFPAVVFVIVISSKYFSTFPDDTRFDYIIVGGGSAGAVVASRLSENRDVSVLLIEAGAEKPKLLNIPALGPLHQLTQFDWQYKTVPQKYGCHSMKNNEMLWPSGKVLGGSSHLNYMMYVPGTAEDFLEWKDRESEHWSYDDISKYFKKSLSFMPLSENIFSTIFSSAVINAAEELNLQNSSQFFKPKLNLNPDGSRWTSDQVLRRHRPNLKILTNTEVKKIILLNKYEAVGVTIVDTGRGSKQNMFAEKEVIICAGTVASAKLLMLSGIGPKDVLAAAKVDSAVDLPVGKNLQDHVTTGLDLVLLNETIFSMSDLTSPWSAWKYYYHGRGPFTSALCETVGLISSSVTSQPYLELMVMMAGVSSDQGLFTRHGFGLKEQVWLDNYKHLTDQAVATILPVLLHPMSRGTIKLDPSHPDGPPLIDPNYLAQPDDVTALVNGLKLVKQLIDTQAMAQKGITFNHRPFESCKSHLFLSTEYWECYVRHVTLTSYHPVGTSSMGSVVDHRLRVYKTNRLRVMDASVMPTLPSGNTNAAVVMIAEKGADLIMEDLTTSCALCHLKDIFVKKFECSVSVCTKSFVFM